jgi:hypothetical protein
MSVEPVTPESAGSVDAGRAHAVAAPPLRDAAGWTKAPRPVSDGVNGGRSVTTIPTEDAPLVGELVPPMAGPDDEIADGGPERQGARMRARQVQRVVRRVDPWSILKLSAAFFACLWMILVVAGFILWRVAVATGMIGNVESLFAELLASETFTIDGIQIFWASAVAGLILVFAGTALTVMMTVLFNLLSEMTGGIRLAVVELETAHTAQAAHTVPDGDRRRALRPTDREPPATR